MSIDLPIVQVAFSDRFKRDVRRLSKRDRQIRLDIQPLIEQLELGEILIASFITSKLLTKFFSLPCIPNLNKLI